MANENVLTTVFAPDWRAGNSYQHHLGESLQKLGVQVEYLSHYRRVFPLLRGMKAFSEESVLHLHWPEAYMGNPGQKMYAFRQARFAYDLTLACRSRPLVVTAHNIYPHNSPRTDLLKQNLKAMYDRADGVISHSAAAVEELSAEFQVSSEKIRVIRHGEVPELIHNLPTRKEAASQLGWSQERPVCLMFGAVSPYKGIEEILKYWNQNEPPFQLVIVGRPDSYEYGEGLKSIAGTNTRITFRFDFVASEELQQWLSVANCCLYNYQQILTSGSIHPPRALGIPVLLPERITSLELGEPNSRVLRFSSMDSLSHQLKRALELGCDYDSARPWRDEHDWASIAEKTMGLYQHVIQSNRQRI